MVVTKEAILVIYQKQEFLKHVAKLSTSTSLLLLPSCQAIYGTLYLLDDVCMSVPFGTEEEHCMVVEILGNNNVWLLQQLNIHYKYPKPQRLL